MLTAIFNEVDQGPLRGIFKQKVEVVLILEGALEADDVWVTREGEDVALAVHTADLVMLNNVHFVYALQGVFLPSILLAHKVHLAEAAISQCSYKVK